MLLSVLFFLCVGLNTGLIWFCLFRPLRIGLTGLRADLLRSRRYFRRPLTETREKALRHRTLLLLRRLGAVILGFAAVLVFYTPSMLFAHYRSSISAAFYSLEALAGMLLGVAIIAWSGRKP